MRVLFYQSMIEAIRLFRNFAYIFWTLVTPLAFYILYTKVFLTDVDNPKMWQAYFLMSMTMFGMMGGSIIAFGVRIVSERQLGWSKLLQIVPIPGITLFMAKIIGQTIVHAIVIVIMFLGGFFINGIELTLSQWFACGVWILLGTLPFLALGTIIGTIKKADTATGIANLLYFPLAILGGMWTPMQFLPETIQKIGKLLPSYHYGNGAWQVVQGGAPEMENILFLTSYFLIFMLISTYRRKKKSLSNVEYIS